MERNLKSLLQLFNELDAREAIAAKADEMAGEAELNARRASHGVQDVRQQIQQELNDILATAHREARVKP